MASNRMVLFFSSNTCKSTIESVGLVETLFILFQSKSRSCEFLALQRWNFLSIWCLGEIMGFAKAAEHPDVRSCQRGLGGKWADGKNEERRRCCLVLFPCFFFFLLFFVVFSKPGKKGIFFWNDIGLDLFVVRVPSARIWQELKEGQTGLVYWRLAMSCFDWRFDLVMTNKSNLT